MRKMECGNIMSKVKAILLVGLIVVLTLLLTVMVHGHGFLLSTIRFLGSLGIILTIYAYRANKNKG